MRDDQFDGYVTKHALTGGIQACRLRDLGDGLAEIVGVRYRDLYHGEGREWHRTYASALSRAENMRQSRIKSLRKSLATMEAMTFKDQSHDH